MSTPDSHDELEDLPPDDPRVQGAPGPVRARWRAHREFVTPTQVPEGARPAEAERALADALERAIAPEAAGPAADVRVVRPARPAWRRRAPLLALAAAVVVVAGIGWLATRAPDREPVMRGTPAPPARGSLATESRTLSDGTLRLEWQPAGAGASYTVVFLTPGLEERARVGDLRQNHLDLKTDALPGGLRARDQVLWRVLAMRGADEVGRSATQAVRLP